MKIVFHVGAPKTATTSLQHAFKDARKQLLREGVSYIPTNRVRNSDFGEALRDETPTLFGHVSRREVRKFLEPWIEKGASQVLISEEGWTNYLIHPRKRGQWARQAPRTFRILKHFRDYDFRVVLTIRRQDSYVLSCYAHLVRHGRVFVPFEKFWRESWNLETMSWLAFIEAFRKEYGADRLVVLPYEHIRDDFPTYMRLFLEQACGIPAERLADVEPAVSELNLAMSPLAIDIAQIVNRHLNEELPGHRLKSLIKDIRLLIPPGEFGRFSPPMDELRETLAGLFAEENRRLNADYVARPHAGFEF
ncbi:hypothetical protein [Prosthecomicrobium sp. N25]|uniref:hypothetical protein n=1 Tax=Prosthecomicrobium sp. N25 TaxID=3129254 RepID=UPI0030789B31